MMFLQHKLYTIMPVRNVVDAFAPRGTMVVGQVGIAVFAALFQKFRVATKWAK
jgi:hypothetical protein